MARTPARTRPHLVVSQSLSAARRVASATRSMRTVFRRRSPNSHREVQAAGRRRRRDFALRPGPAQFGEYVGVEQPAVTRRSCARASLSVPVRCRIRDAGEACIAAISAAPVRSPLRRRNSSAEMTTTSSRPCTVHTLRSFAVNTAHQFAEAGLCILQQHCRVLRSAAAAGPCRFRLR